VQEALNGKQAFRPLFQEARSGADWLPHAHLANNYADSDTTWLANIDPMTISAGCILEAGDAHTHRQERENAESGTGSWPTLKQCGNRTHH
jgi:hypothetical protein